MLEVGRARPTSLSGPERLYASRPGASPFEELQNPLDLTVVDTNTVRERIATISTDGNFNSGWHIHPGPVIIQVQDGYLKITQATCHPNVVGPGETYVETPGVPVIATADKATSWTVTEIFPNSSPGGPDRVPTTSPCPSD
jgi:hypothetical protein